MRNASRSEVWRTHPDALDDGPGSDGSISVLSGPEITVWSSPDPGHDARPESELRLTPDCPVVVGRSDGGLPPYLDPTYRPTRIVPGTGQHILHSGGWGSDNYVSRGHFTLRAIRGGILFVNGVPRRGGGTRPPKNGTRMVAPAVRALHPGEEYLIEAGTALVVRLPNGTELRIDAK
jgi:hypothetical protein